MCGIFIKTNLGKYNEISLKYTQNLTKQLALKNLANMIYKGAIFVSIFSRNKKDK